MKALHIYSSWTAGGAEKTMLSLASALQKRGVENVIVAPGSSYMYAKAAELGLKARKLVIHGTFAPIGLADLFFIILKEKPDILHAHQGKVFWPCVFMKWIFRGKLKVVFHRHAQLPHRFYSRWHYRHADSVIAISRAVADGLISGEKVAPEKVKVIYNGTDFARFNRQVSGREVRERFGLAGKLVVGTVAAMNRPKGKGQEYLLEAAQLVKISFPNIKFLFVGTGEIENDLKKLAKKLGVQNEAVFAGYQEDVEKFMAAMDVFCFLSWDTEGFGQVMVEAQAMGVPVIGTNIGGIPETFRDGITGMLIPPGNSELLAQVLITMLSNRGLMKTMGGRGADLVNAAFSMDKMAEEVMKTYTEILNSKDQRLKLTS